MNLLGLQHAALSVQNLERAIHFYCDVLGFRPYHTVSSDWAMLSLGATTLSLVPGKSSTEAAAAEGVHPAHLGFNLLSVDDVNALHTKLEKAHAPALEKPKHHRDASYGFYFRDTEGNHLEGIFIPLAPARVNLRSSPEVGAILLATDNDPWITASPSDFLTKLRGHSPTIPWEAAFLERTHPTLEDAIKKHLAEKRTRLHLFPFFLYLEENVKRDLEERLARIMKKNPELQLNLWPALGSDLSVQHAFMASAVTQLTQSLVKHERKS